MAGREVGGLSGAGLTTGDWREDVRRSGDHHDATARLERHHDMRPSKLPNVNFWVRPVHSTWKKKCPRSRSHVASLLLTGCREHVPGVIASDERHARCANAATPWHSVPEVS
jgi:hypothetical protein